MKLTTKIALGAGAAIASAALVVTPAMAATYDWSDITVGSFEYSLGNDTLAPDDIYYGNNIDDTLDDQTFEVSIDDFSSSETVACANPQINDAADGSGDKIVSCDAYDAYDLTLKPELRLFASGKLARFTVSVTNATATAIGYQWQYNINAGEENIVWNAEYAAGPQIVNPAFDNWAVMTGYSEGAPAAYAWGGPEGTDRATDWDYDSSDEGYFWTNAKYSLEPGKSVTYAFFTLMPASDTVDDAIRVASWESATVVFGGPGGDVTPGSVAAADTDYSTLFPGLAPGTLVANWGYTEPAALPDTGVSANAGIWAAWAALIAGLGVAGVFMARRRKA